MDTVFGNVEIVRSTASMRDCIWVGRFIIAESNSKEGGVFLHSSAAFARCIFAHDRRLFCTDLVWTHIAAVFGAGLTSVDRCVSRPKSRRRRMRAKPCFIRATLVAKISAVSSARLNRQYSNGSPVSLHFRPVIFSSCW